MNDAGEVVGTMVLVLTRRERVPSFTQRRLQADRVPARLRLEQSLVNLLLPRTVRRIVLAMVWSHYPLPVSLARFSGEMEVFRR